MIKQKQIEKYVLVLNSNPKQVVKVEGFLLKVNEKLRLDEIKYNKLLVATTEAVNNSIIHGNKRDPKKKVVITCELNSRNIVVRVHDEGEGIDVSKLPNPLAKENLLRENGRGIFLMRSLMDTVEFDKTPDGAEVVMMMSLNN